MPCEISTIRSRSLGCCTNVPMIILYSIVLGHIYEIIISFCNTFQGLAAVKLRRSPMREATQQDRGIWIMPHTRVRPASAKKVHSACSSVVSMRTGKEMRSHAKVGIVQ